MDLTKVFSDSKQDRAQWFTFDDPFKINLLYTDKATMTGLLNESKKVVPDRKTRQMVEVTDDDLFEEKLATRIGDWEGLTLGKVAELTNIIIGDEDPSQEIPCTDDNKRAMVQEVYGLNNFIQDNITELQRFTDAKEDGEKKTL